MARKPKAVSPSYITGLAKFLERHYAPRNNYLDEIHSRLTLTHKVPIPEKYQKTASYYSSALIFDMVRKAVAMVGTAMPEPKVRPMRGGEEAQERSSKQEEWLRAAFVCMDENQNVYQQIIHALMVDGQTVVQVSLDEHKWGGFRDEDDTWQFLKRGEDEGPEDYTNRVTEHHRANFPFWWQQVPISQFYPVEDADGLAEVIIVQERVAYPLLRQFGLTRNKDGNIERGRLGPMLPDDSSSDTVKYIEYWNRDYFAQLVEDKVVKSGNHKYERPPFFLVKAVVTSSRDVVEEVMGLPAPLVSAQDNISALATIILNWAYWAGFPTPKLTPKTEFAQLAEDAVIDIKIGEVLKPPVGFDIDYLKFPTTGDDLKFLLDFLKRDADNLGLAAILSGELPRGDVSSPTYGAAVTIAKSIFGTAVANLCRAYDDMSGWMQKMIETIINEDVPVWNKKWVELGPSDIRGYYKTQHTMPFVLPMESMQKSTWMTTLRGQGVPIPFRRILEEGLGYSSPEELEDEWWVEEALKRPEVSNLIISKAMELYQQEIQKSLGTAPRMPVGPGGPYMPQLAGVQQPLQPGMPVAQPQGTPIPGAQGPVAPAGGPIV